MKNISSIKSAFNELASALGAADRQLVRARDPRGYGAWTSRVRTLFYDIELQDAKGRSGSLHSSLQKAIAEVKPLAQSARFDLQTADQRNHAIILKVAESAEKVVSLLQQELLMLPKPAPQPVPSDERQSPQREKAQHEYVHGDFCIFCYNQRRGL